ncbi:MAG: hypothetical protein E7552_01560 [Ruminococcaceae bacterium]|nr:hypothetical protein [Oscillospiraceae bacterium]
MAKSEKRKRLTKERVRRFLNIQNEERVYFVLQLVFAALQCVLAYVTFGQSSFNQFGIALFVVYGVLLALLAAKGWQHKAVRILGRALAALVIFGMAAMFVEVSLNSHWESGVTAEIALTSKEKLGMYAANLCTWVHGFVLTTLPAFAIAARRTKARADIALLHINAWVAVVFAVSTLLLYHEPSWSGETTTLIAFCAPLFERITAGVLLIVHLVCTLAAAFSVYMLYPFGTKHIKKMTEKVRAKLPQDE